MTEDQCQKLENPSGSSMEDNKTTIIDKSPQEEEVIRIPSQGGDPRDTSQEEGVASIPSQVKEIAIEGRMLQPGIYLEEEDSVFELLLIIVFV